MTGWTVPGYSELRELGSGGSGRVVLAVHEATGTPVAVKYPGESLLEDTGFLRAFRAEARLLGDLDSPYVVGLYEYVESPLGAAIVMEAVDGVALRALLRREGPTGPEAALAVLKGSLLGLAAAHRAGVVHRDYKPANVLVAADGSSKLVDFGIAARDGTASGTSGTPLYMAPEQWNGGPASPATDVYAATATFYECLTGEAPYPGVTFAELAVRHVSAPVPAGRVPEPVRGLVLRGLAKDPGERPHDAAAFVEELEAVATAAYGGDWEERGQRRLAALAALLPLLLPSAQGGAAGVAELATTVLRGAGRGGWTKWHGLLAGAGVLALAGVLTVTAVASGGGSGTATARTTATTSAVPGETGGPSGPGTPTAPSSAPPPASPSVSPSASSPASPSATATATDGATGGTAPWNPPAEPGGDTTTAGTGGTGTTGGATAPAGTSTGTTGTPTGGAHTGEPSVPAEVRSVSATGLTRTSRTGATAAIEVATTGTGPVTLTVTWHVGGGPDSLGAQDGTAQTYELSGETAYTVPVSHAFPEGSCHYWGVNAATDPAAAGGSSSQRIPVKQCELR